MENFTFNYNNPIKRIRCIYNYNDNVNNNTFWEGYIITQNVDGVLNIEGYEIDRMDSLEKDGKHHKRYILGKRAISASDKSLSFELYPGNIAPIRYYMYYNSKDGCFYGNWYFWPNKNHPYPQKGKGEAIIHLEDAIVDEKEIVRITEEVANRYRKEYSEEVESYEFLAQNQLLLYDTDNSSSIRKLSKFLRSIRNY